MIDFLKIVSSFFGNIIDLFDSVAFNIGGISVSYYQILIGFIAMSIIVTVFWKGARG